MIFIDIFCFILNFQSFAKGPPSPCLLLINLIQMTLKIISDNEIELIFPLFQATLFINL